MDKAIEGLTKGSRSLDIYIDADACPVKQEVIRVAERHRLRVHMVGNSWMRVGDHPLVTQKVVAEGADAADDWIAEHIAAGDLAITNDIPLAARCVKAGARALSPSGKTYTEANMGLSLATRDLMTSLRETGEITGGPAAFSKKDRSNFLNALEAAIQAGKRAR